MPTPHPRRQAAIAFILVTAVLDVMALGIVIPVLPKLIQEFTGSNARAGLINGLFVAGWAVMQFLFSPLIGSLSDRFGRRPVILISSAGLALDYVLVALAPNLWWFAAARIIGGITTASFSTASAYLADVTPPEGRAKAYGLIGAAWSAGFVAGPLIGGLLGHYSLRAPFWAAPRCPRRRSSTAFSCFPKASLPKSAWPSPGNAPTRSARSSFCAPTPN